MVRLDPVDSPIDPLKITAAVVLLNVVVPPAKVVAPDTVRLLIVGLVKVHVAGAVKVSEDVDESVGRFKVVFAVTVIGPRSVGASEPFVTVPAIEPTN